MNADNKPLVRTINNFVCTIISIVVVLAILFMGLNKTQIGYICWLQAVNVFVLLVVRAMTKTDE